MQPRTYSFQYPYYDPYSIYFGNPTGDATQTVSLDLADYQLDPATVVTAMKGLLEKARVEANTTWANQKDVDLNDYAEQYKARVTAIASQNTPLEALDKMLEKVGKFFGRAPVPAAAPVSQAEWVTYADFLESQLQKYRDDLTELTKEPETYEELTPAQKLEVDRLQKETDALQKKVAEEKRKSLKWYQTEIPFYIGGAIILLYGASVIYKAIK